MKTGKYLSAAEVNKNAETRKQKKQAKEQEKKESEKKLKEAKVYKEQAAQFVNRSVKLKKYNPSVAIGYVVDAQFG